MTQHTLALDVKDLSLSFQSRTGRVPVLRNVSIDIEPGEIVGLVGESGSGKSVMSLQVARLLPEDSAVVESGDVTVNGVSTRSATPRQMTKLRGSQIGFIFQEPMTALSPTMTVGKQLALAIRRHRGGSRRGVREQAIAALDEVRIKNPDIVVDQYPFELSGGMRQRVVIALAMVGNPSLLIADEPTTALDVTVQDEILKLIRQLAQDHGMSVLFVSHDLAVVSNLCQRVFVLYAGEVIERGTTRQIIDAPAHPYTRALVAALPRLDAAADLSPIPGEPPDPRNVTEGCIFAPRCPQRFDPCDAKPPTMDLRGGHHAACWLHAREEAHDAR
jgi:peptide/nickel transport system ATP-binding protein